MSERLTGFHIACETKHCVFDEAKPTSPLGLLFPSSPNLIPATRTDATPIAPFGGRCLMRLILSSMPRHRTDQPNLLDCMFARHEDSSRDIEKSPLRLFAILSESNNKGFMLAPRMRDHIKRRYNIYKI